MILYILILIALYIIFMICNKKFEHFDSIRSSSPLHTEYKKTFNVNPRQTLPPGTININLKFKNKRLEVNQSDYCEDNPTCYPCPNWKHIGAPMCLA